MGPRLRGDDGRVSVRERWASALRASLVSRVSISCYFASSAFVFYEWRSCGNHPFDLRASKAIAI